MADAIQIAQQRREDYEKSISEKEQEIEDLRELIADLDSFIEFGEALLNDGANKPGAMPQDTAPKPVQDMAPKPVQDAQNIIKPVDPENEWDDDDGKQGIARVLAARNG